MDRIDVGDAAKLREALETARLFVTNCPTPLTTPLIGCGMSRAEVMNIIDAALSALSAPPRNCDMPLVVDGPADNNADKAWLVFKRQNPDAYFDVSGLLRCIDWLFAHATEKEGGNDGNE